MDKFNKTYKYAKGIYEANFYSLGTRELRYHDSKLTDANITSSINLGEIVAGLGNVPQIMIPDSARFNIAMTAADIDIRQYQLQTGAELGYNGITQVCEIIVATGADIVLGSTPSAPYGFDKAVAYINGDGTAYLVDVATKKVQDFAATAGEQYAVRYYVAKPANEVLDIGALFTPDMVSCEIKIPVYKAPVGESANTGTLAGNLWAICPRFQFNGDANINATQTGNITPSLSGQAVAFDDVKENVCGASALSSLLYLVWEPANEEESIDDIAVIGGGLDMVATEQKALPIKLLMKSGGLAQPDMSKVVATTSSPTVATVSNGIVTAVGEGDCDIEVMYQVSATKTLTAIVPVSVASA